ncbi:hypothetical protein TraAM80_01218 [Trypanosoma rangeli]|uniref:Uncharacterized protein n=1 Tax=Trypanosoma rangeli TaxID=5698 RepID=A0A3R7MTH0_TRYRA|nr:uncharacterized protein TraAM80_01218 [Trypanosoma rangeli]RNF10953.1 hypothetical protein TraAM80_01218 [Trypanosoma rangeli]|eukprot:RNF10953.1 hypothetical protein TraAM80_01218 [Trypanosoma rangeli]
MTDRHNEAAYYPTADPARMGPEFDFFAAIPYLCEFCLSRPHVVYQPPTLVDLVAAGAIPVEHTSELNSVLPTITLSAEVAPWRATTHESSGTATSSRFLRPPEREGAEAIAEELQRGAHDTSDQEYWSEEYWKSLQTDELDFADSLATSSCFQSTKDFDSPSLKGVSKASAKHRTRGVARRNVGVLTTGHSWNERLDLHSFCPHRPTSCEYGSSVSSVRGHAALGPASRAGARMCGDREVRLGLQGVSSPIQSSKKLEALRNTRDKTKRPRQPPGRVAASLKPKSRFGKATGSIGEAGAFRVYSSGEKDDFLFLNASGTGQLSISVSSSPREVVRSEKINAKPMTTVPLPGAHNARASVSRGPVAGHSHPETLAPKATASPRTAPKLTSAPHWEKEFQKRTLASALSGSSVKPRDDSNEGGGGNRKNTNTEKILPITSGKDAAVSRNNSGVLVPVETPHVEESKQVISRLDRKGVESGGTSVGAEVGVLRPLGPNPLLRDEKQMTTKCCTLM